jgi:hypothetical protein
MTSKVYEIEHDGATEWYVAESTLHALEFWIAHRRRNEEIRGDDAFDVSVDLIPQDRAITIRREDGPGFEEERRQTAAEWAKESEYGFLASTEF